MYALHILEPGIRPDLSICCNGEVLDEAFLGFTAARRIRSHARDQPLI